MTRRKAHHKKIKPGAAAQLIRKNPRTFTGDLNDKKALKAFRRGETVYNSSEPVETNLTDILKDINERIAHKRGKTSNQDL